MKIKEIVKKLKSREINCEQALESLAKIGYCPNLLNDDNGYWAVTFDGFQNVVTGDSPEDVQTVFFIEAESWKDSIYEALVWALRDEM